VRLLIAAFLVVAAAMVVVAPSTSEQRRPFHAPTLPDRKGPTQLVFYPAPIEEVVAAAREQVPRLYQTDSHFIVDAVISIRDGRQWTHGAAAYRAIANRRCPDAAAASWAVVMEFPASKDHIREAVRGVLRQGDDGMDALVRLPLGRALRHLGSP